MLGVMRTSLGDWLPRHYDSVSVTDSVAVEGDTHTQMQPSDNAHGWSILERLGNRSTSRTIEVTSVMDPMLKRPIKPIFLFLSICSPINVGIGKIRSIKSVTEPKAACVI